MRPDYARQWNDAYFFAAGATSVQWEARGWSAFLYGLLLWLVAGVTFCAIEWARTSALRRMAR